jgi:flagellin
MGVGVTDGNDLGETLSRVDGWLEKTMNAAANLGALSSRIAIQTEFVAKLSDSIDRGVGRLVDADMNEASTRLKAL